MPIKSIYAYLSCKDLIASMAWYAAIFDRQPDANPMDGLAEWHLGEHAGFQLFHDAASDGDGTMTLIVSDLAGERQRLHALGMHPHEIEPGKTVSILHMSDPDGNHVVLAQPA